MSRRSRRPTSSWGSRSPAARGGWRPSGGPWRRSRRTSRSNSPGRRARPRPAPSLGPTRRRPRVALRPARTKSMLGSGTVVIPDTGPATHSSSGVPTAGSTSGRAPRSKSAWYRKDFGTGWLREVSGRSQRSQKRRTPRSTASVSNCGAGSDCQPGSHAGNCPGSASDGL